MKFSLRTVAGIRARVKAAPVWAAFAIAFSFSISTPACAEFIANVDQVGTNVVADGTGTLNLADLTFRGALDITSAQVWPYGGVIVFGPGGSADDYSGIVAAPSTFGNGGDTFTSSESGNILFISAGSSNVFVPVGYVSGTTLTSSDTFDNATFASLGITPGTYTYSWGTGANADSFVLNIGTTTAVPEPSSIAVLLAALGLIGGAMYFERRKKIRIS